MNGRLPALADFLKLMESRGQGPSPGFKSEHALLALMTIARSKTMGRQALASNSGFGEGSARTILKRLKQAGLVEVDAQGIRLTGLGRSTYQSITKKLSPPLTLRDSKLTLGQWQVAVLARSAGSSVSNGIRQRDAAVRIGADGATSYVFAKGRFEVPGGSVDCEKDFPSSSWSTLRTALNPHDGDAIIVCGGSDETVAKLGALSAGLTVC